MTRLTPRLRWRQAVASHAFPASQRPVKATLLVLSELVSATGELHEWRDVLAEATTLPIRTLTRHLQRAVEDGWLIRDVPGGHGRRSQYRVTIPGVSCEPSVAHNCRSCGPSTRTQLPEVVGHPAAHSIETEHSRERVPSTRQPARQTTTPDEAGVEREDDVTEQAGNYRGWPSIASRRLFGIEVVDDGSSERFPDERPTGEVA